MSPRTVRWQGLHGWRFGTVAREDAKYVWVQIGTSRVLQRVAKSKISEWPGERKK